MTTDANSASSILSVQSSTSARPTGANVTRTPSPNENLIHPDTAERSTDDTHVSKEGISDLLDALSFGRKAPREGPRNAPRPPQGRSKSCRRCQQEAQHGRKKRRHTIPEAGGKQADMQQGGVHVLRWSNVRLMRVKLKLSKSICESSRSDNSVRVVL